MKNMRARSRRSYLDKATYSAYLDIPVTYIVCEDDDILGQEFQRGRIDFLREIKGLDQVQVESLKAGHRPMDTDPEAAGKKIVEILSKLQELNHTPLRMGSTAIAALLHHDLSRSERRREHDRESCHACHCVDPQYTHPSHNSSKTVDYRFAKANDRGRSILSSCRGCSTYINFG